MNILTNPWILEWTYQHLMSVNGKFKDITDEDFLAEANRFGIGTGRRVIQEVKGALQQWFLFANNSGVPSFQSNAILNSQNS